MDWSITERRRLYARGLAIRGLTASTFLAFFGVVWLVGWATQIAGMWAVFSLLLILVIVNPVMWIIGGRRSFVLGDFKWHWALDVMAVTGIVYYLGVFDIPLAVTAYIIMIVSSATFGSQSTALSLAHWSAVLLVLLVVAEELKIIPHQHLGFAAHISLEGKVISTVGSIVLFYVFGYLAGTLASQLRRKAEEVEMQKREVEEAYRKEQVARDRMVLLSSLVQHDIYGPLSAISGACQLALKSCEEGSISEATHFIEMVDDRLRSIEAAVGSLGVFSGDGDAWRPEEWPLKMVVDELMEDLGAESRGRRVNIAVAGVWPTLRVRRQELYHVLRNLVMNGLKAVDDDGSGQLSIESKPVADNAGWEVIVTDNGHGVSGDVTAHLQQYLRRLGSRKPQGGYGAGLALASNVVRGWGGEIRYDKNPGGRGSVFRVILPSSALGR